MEQRETSPLWTIDELGQEVQRALSEGYNEPANRQIRAIPDRRTIRYYTTLGLLDGPARMRGRTALYSRRHLLQVVAIKRLQARGLALATIQEELAGLPDSELAAHACMSPTTPAPLRAAREHADEQPAALRRGGKFWGEEPVAPDPAVKLEAAAPPAPDVAVSLLAETTHVARLTALSLAPGATLLLDTQRQVGGEDLAAVRAAAARLVEQLKHLGLLPEHVVTRKGKE